MKPTIKKTSEKSTPNNKQALTKSSIQKSQFPSYTVPIIRALRKSEKCEKEIFHDLNLDFQIDNKNLISKTENKTNWKKAAVANALKTGSITIPVVK